MKKFRTSTMLLLMSVLAVALGAFLTFLVVRHSGPSLPHTTGKITWEIIGPSSQGLSHGETLLEKALFYHAKYPIIITCYAGSAGACNQAEELKDALVRAGREAAYVESWGNHWFAPQPIWLKNITQIHLWPEDLTLPPKNCKESTTEGGRVLYDCGWRQRQ